MSRREKALTFPFFVFLAFLAFTQIFATEAGGSPNLWLNSPQYWTFPLQTMVCAGLLFFYRREYAPSWPRQPFFAISIAVLVLAVWISPQWLLGAAPRVNGFDPTVFAQDPALYWGTLIFRFVRLAIVVPIVEELFWRGWLLRWLINPRTELVPFGTFTWRSFLLVGVFFTLEHQPSDWPAAFFCGLTYNWIAIRTKSLGACILAHALTNLLLGFYTMHTRQWGFW